LAQVVPLHAACERDAHRRDEIRIFAEGFVDAPPARVARDVHHRRERLGEPDGPQLPALQVRHLLDRRGIPGCRQRDGRRKMREPRRDHAVQRLVVKDGGNAESCLRDEVALDGVYRLRDDLWRLVPHGAEPRDVADAAPELRLELLPDRPLGAEQRHRVHPSELHRLLFQRHFSEQLVGAFAWALRTRGSRAAS